MVTCTTSILTLDMVKPKATTSKRRREPAARSNKGKTKAQITKAGSHKQHAPDGTKDDGNSSDEEVPMTHHNKRTKHSIEPNEEVDDDRQELEIEEVDDDSASVGDQLSEEESDEVQSYVCDH